MPKTHYINGDLNVSETLEVENKVTLVGIKQGSESNILYYNHETGEIFYGETTSEEIPSLEKVTRIGNTTSNTIQFTNPATSLITSGNVEINGKISVNKINFTDNIIYISGKNAISEIEDNIITINVNDNKFCIVSIDIDSGSIEDFIIKNQPTNSIIHGIINIKSDGDKILFKIENYQSGNFFSYKLFS